MVGCQINSVARNRKEKNKWHWQQARLTERGRDNTIQLQSAAGGICINFSSLWGPVTSSYSYVHCCSSLSTFCFVVKINRGEIIRRKKNKRRF